MKSLSNKTLQRFIRPNNLTLKTRYVNVLPVIDLSFSKDKSPNIVEVEGRRFVLGVGQEKVNKRRGS